MSQQFIFFMPVNTSICRAWCLSGNLHLNAWKPIQPHTHSFLHEEFPKILISQRGSQLSALLSFLVPKKKTEFELHIIPVVVQCHTVAELKQESDPNMWSIEQWGLPRIWITIDSEMLTFMGLFTVLVSCFYIVINLLKLLFSKWIYKLYKTYTHWNIHFFVTCEFRCFPRRLRNLHHNIKSGLFVTQCHESQIRLKGFYNLYSIQNLVSLETRVLMGT